MSILSLFLRTMMLLCLCYAFDMTNPCITVAEEYESFEELRMKADRYWIEIQNLATDVFGGFNIELTVKTQYNFSDSDTASKGAGIGLSMPIYSKSQKITSRNQAREFLEHGSLLVMSYRDSIAAKEITTEECKFQKSIMTEYGVEGAKAYFDCKRRLATMHLTVEQKERDIKSMLDPYQKRRDVNEKVKLIKD
jgi:hypothetical protein